MTKSSSRLLKKKKTKKNKKHTYKKRRITCKYKNMRGGEIKIKNEYKDKYYTDIIFVPPPKKNFWGKTFGGEITEEQKQTLISEVAKYTPDKKYVKIEIYHCNAANFVTQGPKVLHSNLIIRQKVPQDLNFVPDKKTELSLRDNPEYLFNYLNANYLWRFYTKINDRQGYQTYE